MSLSAALSRARGGAPHLTALASFHPANNAVRAVDWLLKHGTARGTTLDDEENGGDEESGGEDGAASIGGRRIISPQRTGLAALRGPALSI